MIDDLTDSSDPSRKMMRQIAGSFAEYEKARLVAKLKAARERKRLTTGKCEGGHRRQVGTVRRHSNESADTPQQKSEHAVVEKADPASGASSELTSAGVPLTEVPDFAAPHVEWLDGRHVPAEDGLPPVDQFPIPDALLPFLGCTPTAQPDQRPWPIRTVRGNGLQPVAPVPG